MQGRDAAWVLADPVQVEELLQRLARWKVRAWPAPHDRRSRSRRCVLASMMKSWARRLAARTARRVPAYSSVPRMSRCAPTILRNKKLLPHNDALRAQVLLPMTSAAVQRLQRARRFLCCARPTEPTSSPAVPRKHTSVNRILALLTTTRVEAAPGPLQPASDAVRLQVTTTLGQKVELVLWSRDAESFVQRDLEPPQRLTEPVPELWTLDELTFAPLQLLAVEGAAVRRITRRFPSSPGSSGRGGRGAHGRMAAPAPNRVPGRQRCSGDAARCAIRPPGAALCRLPRRDPSTG